MIHHSDCIDILRTLPNGSVDMILQDPPYNITSCSWECDLDFPVLWKEWERVTKENAAIVMTASQPFTSKLVLSNEKLFKYEWIWEKDKPSNFALANIQPMKYHENIIVFYKKQPTYNKQLTKRTGSGSERYKYVVDNSNHSSEHLTLGDDAKMFDPDNKNPGSIVAFSTGRRQDIEHPTQKPVDLFRYLIRTYTNEGETVFDGYAGSGTTAVACHLENRKYICCEREPQHHETATKRIEEATRQVCLFR